MGEKQVVLCVDDEEEILESLKRNLRTGAFEILTATSGAQALAILEKKKIDLIISDQRMPGMFGYELLRAVKEKHPCCMRILLSGYSDFESLVKTVNEGEIFRFISKPWDTQELKKTVNFALDQQKIILPMKNLMIDMWKISDVVENFSVDISEDQSTVLLNVEAKGKIISQENIFKIIDFCFEALNIKKEKSKEIISSAFSKEDGKIIFKVNLGGGVILKIRFPKDNPSSS